MDLSEAIKKRCFKRLNSIQAIEGNFDDVVHKFEMTDKLDKHICHLTGRALNNKDAMLEALLFTGLPIGDDGITLVETLTTLSTFTSGGGATHIKIGSLEVSGGEGAGGRGGASALGLGAACGGGRRTSTGGVRGLAGRRGGTNVG